MTKDNVEELVSLAEQLKTKQLERTMQGEDPLGNAHCVLVRSKEMSKNVNRTGEDAADRPTPFEVAVLSRVVRAHVIPEADLVSSWGMGPWAAPALDGLQAEARKPPRGGQPIRRSRGVSEQAGSMDRSDR